MSSQNASENRFLTRPTGPLFVANAVPMLVVMLMSGVLTVVDAAFLGRFVGTDALAAVSVVFPAVMITIALSTLVGSGMSSLLARHLGAGKTGDAQAVFAQAHGLALFLSAVSIALFGLGGGLATRTLAANQPVVARMAYTYLAILIGATPIQLLLSVHADAGRNEGRAGLMALLSLGVTLANIVLDYLLIARLHMGVAGSAWGTAMAQGLGLALLLGLRLFGTGPLTLPGLLRARWIGGWRAITTLGAPVSLSFVGIALVSATVITTLRLSAGPGYVDSIAAYGIVTRMFSFAFMPMMAIALATQAIVGNNVGARLYHRSDAVLRLALIVAFVYCGTVEAAMLLGQPWIGPAFVSETAVIAGVGNVLHKMAALYLFTGPVLVLAMYFQAIGRPAVTAALTLAKPFLLSPLLIATLGLALGEGAMWYAFPIADGIVAAIALWIVASSRSHSTPTSGFGLTFQKDT
ncbi:putative MATE family efflux protein [Sagittula marina]|uniref:Multidrug export protein MepA n=1 Tax=Sagittula marina TaxID=943940 RepID=A0A7W6DZP5_9RHOB|nr:MATE family efflux transporter [Sagittula marina]MBB3988289.1 putative MATE family efflux protein [Sagittula marina]